MDETRRLIIHPDFEETLRELSDKVNIPQYGQDQDSSNLQFPSEIGKLTELEKISAYKVDPKSGSKHLSKYIFAAYDESWFKYSALEGTAFFTTHAVVISGKTDYLPTVLATFNFYTRASSLAPSSKYIKHVDDIDVEFKRDLMRDKVGVLLDTVPDGFVLFVDGPLISGDLYTIMLDANKRFLEKNIIPIFFTKNSQSNIVTENIDSLKGKYNSDMHWLNEFLRPGNRSSFFRFVDQHNSKNTKAFCYMKAFESSPQRIEMHTDTYKKHITQMPELIDLIAYLMFVQGDKKNPQLRPIAIAEKYARATKSALNIKKYLKDANITATVNETRFGG